MAERVTPSSLDVRWDPNAPAAVLASRDDGRTALALRPHVDDADQSCVVLVWRSVHFASAGAPNDEALPGHRLYGKGLADLLWLGVVEDSELVRDLKKRASVHPRYDRARLGALVHHVVLTKETTIEVVADELAVRRLPGGTLDAVSVALATS